MNVPMSYACFNERRKKSVKVFLILLFNKIQSHTILNLKFNVKQIIRQKFWRALLLNCAFSFVPSNALTRELSGCSVKDCHGSPQPARSDFGVEWLQYFEIYTIHWPFMPGFLLWFNVCLSAIYVIIYLSFINQLEPFRQVIDTLDFTFNANTFLKQMHYTMLSWPLFDRTVSLYFVKNRTLHFKENKLFV